MKEVNQTELAEMLDLPTPWHAVPDNEVYVKLQTSLSGLTPEQVQERLLEFGRNTLPTRKPPSLLEIILHQFKSPLIYVLLVAAAIAVATGDLKDAAFVLGVIVLNAAIGTTQEWRAEQSAHALQHLLRIQARVRRAGQQSYVDAEELVPGDVVLLESGDKVPADLRLVQVNNLAVDESLLTGESVAVNKKLVLQEIDAPLGDRNIMAYAGSAVVSGRGVGLVVATGSSTEVGKIARVVAEEKGTKPPLIVRMEKFARQISVVVLVFAAILGTIAYGRGMAFEEVLFLVIAMAVSAIPEGLPVALTVALSLSSARMAKRHVIVRKLAAVESLGSCTVIASDKTGTLTVNQQTAKAVVLSDGERVEVGGQGYNDEGQITMDNNEDPPKDVRSRLEALARDAILCNEAVLRKSDGQWVHSGDAMDVALLAFGYKLGLDPQDVRDRFPMLAHIPFESEHRFAATLNRLDGEDTLTVKGAVETVLSFCDRMQTSEGIVPLDRHFIEQQALQLAEEGYRVLAFASTTMSPEHSPETLDRSHITQLIFQALVGFIDPFRPEVPAAVETACQAGVKAVMVTGDHPATALAIARQLGIAATEEQVTTGQELTRIGDTHVPEFYERVKRSTVFARVSPHQKLHIVEALMGLGNFVAVTGDGVNDAPALRKANIGVAMGSGTDIAIAAGQPIPLLPIQILWLNLVTNGIQDVALAFEAGEKGLMRLPPRKPTEGLFNRKMIEQVVLTGFVMAVICVVGWAWLIHSGWEEMAARNALLTLFVLMQFYHALNCRSEYTSVFRVPIRNNPVLIGGIAVAFAVHVLSTQLPFMQSLLRTQPLALPTWVVFAAIAAAILLVVEVYKWQLSRRELARSA